MLQFKVKNTVIEVRESLQKMVRRGYIEEKAMKTIVRKFAEEKTKVEEGQRFITILKTSLE